MALTVADVAHVREWVIISVRRSKSDQEWRGAEKGIPYASTQCKLEHEGEVHVRQAPNVLRVRGSDFRACLGKLARKL